MVKIRMMRMGSKKSPFYRVIAIDERKQRDGRPLEFLGTYDPRVNPPLVNLNLDGIDAWTAKGAQLSDTNRQHRAASASLGKHCFGGRRRFRGGRRLDRRKRFAERRGCFRDRRGDRWLSAVTTLRI